MTADLDTAWRRACSADEGTHRSSVAANVDVTLRPLDHGWAAADGTPEQTWLTRLAPGEHDVAVTTARIGGATTFTGGITSEFLLVGDLSGDAPEWRRVEGELPFRRGVAVVTDLPRDDEDRCWSHWSDARRALDPVVTLPDGTQGRVRFTAISAPLLVSEDDGPRVVAATTSVALLGARDPDNEILTHGLAERWEGLRGGRVVAIALDLGTGLRRTLDGLRTVDDPWLAPVGTPLPCPPDAIGEEPDYSEDYERIPYADAFVPALHVSDRVVTAALGAIRFPSGVATVVNPTRPDLATDLTLGFPPDRDLLCFVAPTVSHHGDLLVRTGDTVPETWRCATLRDGVDHGGHYGRGLIALCDRGFADRLRDDESFTERISERAFSLNPMVLHDPESGAPIGVVISTESDLMVRALLGLDAGGAVVAVALEAADAADVSAWS